MTRPRISVIITAFNRRKYLKNAIDSVLNQTLDSAMYEIIIVTNFEVDLQIDKKHFSSIIICNTEKERLNLMIYGIKAAKGDYLCFLDDDDLFNKDKLELIFHLFEIHGSLGYIHNVFGLIDEIGNNVESNVVLKRFKQVENSFYIRYNSIRKNIKKITKFNGFVNLSSISIRKSVINWNNLDFFSDLPGNMDEFIFYELLQSGYDILLSGNKLSYYRIHPENNSKPKNLIEMNYYNHRLYESVKMLNTLLERTKFSYYGRMKLKYWEYKTHLFENDSDITIGFLTGTIYSLVKYRTDYFFSIVVFTVYRIIFNRPPISLVFKYESEKNT